MTLAEWAAGSEVPVERPSPHLRGVAVTLDVFNPWRRYLWHLDDYRVSSAAGPVVWLVPINLGGCGHGGS
jgi:hypothetical protein